MYKCVSTASQAQNWTCLPSQLPLPCARKDRTRSRFGKLNWMKKIAAGFGLEFFFCVNFKLCLEQAHPAVVYLSVALWVKKLDLREWGRVVLIGLKVWDWRYWTPACSLLLCIGTQLAWTSSTIEKHGPVCFHPALLLPPLCRQILVWLCGELGWVLN